MNGMSKIVINIANDFSRFPYGRLDKYSETSGETFRKNFLIPALKEHSAVIIELDGTEGYGSSFLDEAFANLIRVEGFDKEEVLTKISFVSKDDPSLIDEIMGYIDGVN